MAQTLIASLLNKTIQLSGIELPLHFNIDIPRRREFGNYSTNLAIVAARQLAQNPFELAQKLVKQLETIDQEKICLKIEAVKPGFINFHLSDRYLQKEVSLILEKDHQWGKSQKFLGQKILLEFVSANPTGPLHVGHGRWAVVGDVIARLLSAVGYQVDKEFYVNNVGSQVEKLEKSVIAVREGRAIPEGGYGGAYVKEIQGNNRAEMLVFIINQQRAVLQEICVNFERWFYESELHNNDLVNLGIKRLYQLGHTFEAEGAIWFKAQEYGDDKNRVLVRADGLPTYFAADIAYHLDKFARGYDKIINIWGTDHHGYINRLKIALQALEQPVSNFEIIIGQLVTLYRGHEPVRMSKRTGEMITLQEVVEEIGADAIRFFFAATDVNSHLDFDLELAKKQTNDNPVYYVQYAHARICSILKKAEPENRNSELGINVALSSLSEPAERELMLKLIAFPDLVEEAARLRQPHRLTEYGKELATVFHHFYEKCRVIGNPARVALVNASRITLRNVLELLGITAPETM